MQRVRIEAAKKAIEENDPSLDQLLGITGYKDVKTFRMMFKRLTGLSPQKYRKKYSRLLASA
jgi:YesN/AraC family two-component response regulator